MEHRRYLAKPVKKSEYELAIKTYRDIMSDEEMGVFLTVYEEGSIELAAEELGLTPQEVQDIVDQYIPRKEERRTSLGEPYRRRLTQVALRAILETYNLDEDEKRIMTSLIDAQNQVVAAASLNMRHSTFHEQYMAIRKKYGF